MGARGNTQQDDLYNAQRVLPLGEVFDNMAQCQSYVDSLTDSWWWPIFYPEIERVFVTVSDIDTSYACIAGVPTVTSIGEIRLTIKQMTARTIAHELAHVFAHRLHASGSHDPWYAREFLVTAYCMLGPEAYSDLYASFIRHGVQIAGGTHTLTDTRIVL